MLIKLNRYGIQIKQWLKNEYPIRYQELILDGTLMEKSQKVIANGNGKTSQKKVKNIQF